MQIPTLGLQPPPKYGDPKELEEVLSAAVPTLMTSLAEIFGKRTPRLTRKDSKTLKRRTGKIMRNGRPYALALTALQPGPDQRKALYALHEGWAKENLRASGVRISDDQDAFERLLRYMEGKAQSPKNLAKFPAYADAKRAIYDMVLSICQHVNGAEIDRRLKEWYASQSWKRSIQSRVIWPTLVRKWRHSQPARLTLKLAAELSEEYKASASILEERLRFLVWLDEMSQGVSTPWAEQEKRNLYRLLEAAKTSSKLSWLPPFIERHVRNALAHGVPGINLNKDECRFHDSTHTVTWKTAEFFEKTKQLTLVTCALMEMEGIIQLVQLQITVEWMWQAAQAEPQNP
jgi:hypothetical protein